MSIDHSVHRARGGVSSGCRDHRRCRRRGSTTPCRAVCRSCARLLKHPMAVGSRPQSRDSDRPGRDRRLHDDDCRRSRGGWPRRRCVTAAPPCAAAHDTTAEGERLADAAPVLAAVAARPRSASRERLLPSNNFAFPTEPLRRLGVQRAFPNGRGPRACWRWADAGYALPGVSRRTRAATRSCASSTSPCYDGAAQFHGSAETRACTRRVPRSAARIVFKPQSARSCARRRHRRTALLWEAANFAASWSSGAFGDCRGSGRRETPGGTHDAARLSRRRDTQRRSCLRAGEHRVRSPFAISSSWSSMMARRTTDWLRVAHPLPAGVGHTSCGAPPRAT